MHITKKMTVFMILLVIISTLTAKYIVYGKQYATNTKIYTINKQGADMRQSFSSGALLEKSLILRPIKNGVRPVNVWVTAYTSDPNETDDTPYITASGSIVRDGVAAANFLPIGTRFKIPNKFGDKVFVVEDRMNSRYNNQYIVDLWFANKSTAKIFGRRYLEIEIM